MEAFVAEFEVLSGHSLQELRKTTNAILNV
jgi:hypothetical protein